MWYTVYYYVKYVVAFTFSPLVTSKCSWVVRRSCIKMYRECGITPRWSKLVQHWEVHKQSSSVWLSWNTIDVEYILVIPWWQWAVRGFWCTKHCWQLAISEWNGVVGTETGHSVTESMRKTVRGCRKKCVMRRLIMCIEREILQGCSYKGAVDGLDLLPSYTLKKCIQNLVEKPRNKRLVSSHLLFIGFHQRRWFFF